MICPKCLKRVEGDSKFCSFCGSEVNVEELNKIDKGKYTFEKNSREAMALNVLKESNKTILIVCISIIFLSLTGILFRIFGHSPHIVAEIIYLLIFFSPVIIDSFKTKKISKSNKKSIEFLLISMAVFFVMRYQNYFGTPSGMQEGIYLLSALIMPFVLGISEYFTFENIFLLKTDKFWLIKAILLFSPALIPLFIYTIIGLEHPRDLLQYINGYYFYYIALTFLIICISHYGFFKMIEKWIRDSGGKCIQN